MKNKTVINNKPLIKGNGNISTFYFWVKYKVHPYHTKNGISTTLFSQEEIKPLKYTPVAPHNDMN